MSSTGVNIVEIIDDEVNTMFNFINALTHHMYITPISETRVKITKMPKHIGKSYRYQVLFKAYIVSRRVSAGNKVERMVVERDVDLYFPTKSKAVKKAKEIVKTTNYKLYEFVENGETTTPWYKKLFNSKRKG